MNKPFTADDYAAQHHELDKKRTKEIEDLDLQFGVATRLAGAFRDKFDFSDTAQFDRLADIAFDAAAALVAKRRGVADAAQARYDAGHEKLVKEYEKANPKPVREAATDGN